MSDLAQKLNQDLEDDAPAIARLLSPLGRRAAFPPDIPFQAAQARGKTFNGTIGQITDGAGRPVPVPALAAGLASLGEGSRDRALLYSPVEGIADLRRAWREWQRRGVPEATPSSLPIVTVGLTHGLSLVADLFGGPGRKLAVPGPFWGNYRQAFALRTGAEVVSSPAFRDGRYDPEAIPRALAGVPPGEPALAILNLPSNPGGYSPTEDERRAVVAALVAEAGRRPLLVLCDDAYAGLVYEPEIPRSSLFWDLAGAHPDLVPVKVDGATKELSFFGGRVGFLTFAVAPESPAAAGLESKVKCLVRATLGSVVATSQILVLEALRHPGVADQVEELRLELAGRYRALRAALADVDPALLRPLPFNSGCFALVELPEGLGLTAEQVRQHLLAEHDTGVVSIAPRYLRIAFCSVREDALPELVRRLAAGVAELAAEASP